MRPVIRFQPGRDRRMANGHPWAFSNEIDMTAEAKALPPGTLVDILSADGAGLGVGMFNPRTLIAVRRVSRQARQAVDADFLAGRIARALALRDRLFPDPYYRLIHAEADDLPGLIIDRYGPVLVVQQNTAGMDLLREPLLAALHRVLAPEAILLRNDSPARELEGLKLGIETAHGTVPDRVTLVENGCRFTVDVGEGQKTGWFFDQRDNRAAAARLAAGGRVLDVYSYAGGFGVQAAVAGAAEVTCIDRSKLALSLVETAADLNGVADRVRTLLGDGAQAMERLAADGERFDLVIADPPAFVKTKKDLAAGLKAYRKMVRLAAGLVKPDGFLLAASCSHHVDPEAFANEVRAGLAKAGRIGRILRRAGAGADHPVHAFLPESAYLKAELMQLD